MIPPTTLGNILIVDRDQAISELLRLNLKSEGYAVTTVASTAQLDQHALRNVHLLIIDGADDDPSGCDVIRTIRESNLTLSMGIIYCSRLDNDRMLIEALDAGADDVVRKPFSLREMLARVRAILRRRSRAVSNIDEANILQFKDITIDIANRTVSIDGERIGLSNTEYAILELLLRNINSYTSREVIFHSVWPDGMGANDRIVDTNISRLRRKLGSMGTNIINRTGLGYMIS